MGWWGHGIMEGDAPLDYLAEISRYIEQSGLYPFSEVAKPKRRAAVRKALEAGWVLARGKGEEVCEKEIYIQVLACLAMAVGMKFPRGFKAKALWAADNDSWANDGDPGRRAKVEEYRAAVKGYKGVSLVLEDKGLFDAIADKAKGWT